ncbi:oligogalacturonate lyase family protein [Sphingomonas montana]|uniref:oligogalacturonate lyase family protein n=1 Tax=Sphingomonas montana TaxID=1843236 RepID=UPI00096D2DDF|nr:oligogalacturonate lyase family protein [Sphingomonas montana]
MRTGMWAAALCALAIGTGTPAATPVIDPATGHRVVRISTAPGMASLYFHQNPFTPQGDKMVIATADGIAAIDLKDWSIRPIVRGAGLELLFAGRRTRTVYYARRGKAGPGGGPNGEVGATTVFAADIDSGKARTVATIPAGSIGSINADETLLLGQVAERAMPLQPGGTGTARYGQADYAANGPDGKPLPFADAKEVRLNDRLEAKIPMEIFTIDIRTGARKVVHRATDWLNHLQFSPTDPGLLMFCHEGPWHKVDRIWTIRTDGSGLTKVHARTMNMEIAGHEYWSPDGKTIWYDLQTPRGQVFWLAGYDIATRKRTWYHLERDQWSVHYTQSPDGRLFAGDGGDAGMVAHAPDGKWIYAFTPSAIPDVAGIHAADSASLIAPGLLTAEKLVDMRGHDYRLEPNIHFTPDGKWLIFRSNKDGDPQIYAVEVARAR